MDSSASGLLLKGINFDFAGRVDKKNNQDKISFKKFNLSVHKGEIVSIIGRSGMGKSTLIRLIAGFLNPSNKDFIRTWNGKEIKQPTSRVKIVFQEYSNAVFDWLTVKQNLLLGEKCSSLENPFRYKEVLNSLELDGDLENRLSKDLSGGQKQRVQLARILLTDPELIILDEPDSSLDIHTKNILMKYIVNSHDKHSANNLHLTWLIVTHDLKNATWISSKVFIVQKENGVTGLKEVPGYNRRTNDVETADQDRIFLQMLKEYKKILGENFI